MNILYIVNVDWFFISHRLPIAIAAKKNGYEVHIATKITKYKTQLESYGFKVHE
jgi:UDP:flavonoid glycosyltransferase YjiC (YdhE family)